MILDTLLNRLDRVKSTGPDQWIARCPRHDDRSPSLSVKACGDGRTLVHCFAGCLVEDICSALGLTTADLMPERSLDHRKRRVRSAMPSREALISLDHEALVVALIAKDAHEQKHVNGEMLARLEQAVARIGKVRDAVTPARHRP